MESWETRCRIANSLVNESVVDVIAAILSAIKRRLTTAMWWSILYALHDIRSCGSRCPGWCLNGWERRRMCVLDLRANGRLRRRLRDLKWERWMLMANLTLLC